MRPYKHPAKHAGSPCGGGRLVVTLVVVVCAVVCLYGWVISSMMTSRTAAPPASSSEVHTSVEAPPASSSSSSTLLIKKENIDDILDTITAIVECETTHGPLTIDVRENWAPLGAAQYLSLVDQEFFTDLPFFRVAPRYITQFGAKLQANNKAQVKTIKDDPTLWGKRDMDFGYLFFAGSGPNSRHNQMVLALCEQKGCITTGLGKAPWEVPLGTVRKENFETLKSIMATGFPYPKLEMPSLDKKAGGPNQGKIRTDPSYLAREYPDMAYWQRCKVTRRHLDIRAPIKSTNKEIIPAQPSSINKSPESKSESIFVRFDIDLTHGEVPESKYFIVEVVPDWAPLGTQRFLELVESKFFDNCRFFRALKNFVAQFGIAAEPSVSKYWRKKAIPDDPVVVSNKRGTLTFATSGPNTRTSQIFINFNSNAFLDKQKFAPFGRVVEGLESAVDAIYTGYGEGGNGKGTDGKGPNQNMLNNKGEPYLQFFFPKLTIIRSARVLKDYSAHGND